MTVKDLIELNQMIVDVSIEVRIGGGKLLDYLGIGNYAGVKPPYPIQVPKERRHVGNTSACMRKDGKYIDKSINSRDDGKDYWQVKTNRIPKEWLNLEVYSWSSSRAFRGLTRRGLDDAEAIRIIALPSEESLEIKEDKPKQTEQIKGQMSMFDEGEG